MDIEKIEIRLAIETDLPALIRAGESIFDYPVKPDRALQFFADPRHHLFIAVLDGEVVGMISSFDYIHPDKDPQMFMNEAAVKDELQGKGIGRKLVQAMNEYAKTIGCTGAWLATEESNTAARKAYAYAGGVEDPEPVVLIEMNWEA